MKDFNQLKTLCQQQSSISIPVIDEFLIYYAAQRDKVDREFDNRIQRYKAVQKEMPASWARMIKSQYIAHRIFKKDGLIKKYLNHAAIKNLEPEQQNFLVQQSGWPWRFSFSNIVAHPSPDFYEMEDVFTGERFLLYSPAVTRTLEDRPVNLWFSLIAFNGECWQTFGPINGYQSFDEDDIYFFATELNHSIESEDDLLNDVEENPIPYMTLAYGSDFPIIMSEGIEVVQIASEVAAVDFNMQELKKLFKIEYMEGVFKLTHDQWSGSPHFAAAYYEEDNSNILLTALTDKGYHQMANLLNQSGYSIPLSPDIRIHPSLLTTMKRILKREIEIDPYSYMFNVNLSPEDAIMIEKLNAFMQLAMPFINDGIQPDIEALAKQADLEVDIARELLQKLASR